MDTDHCYSSIIGKLADGRTFKEVSAEIGISRQVIWKRMRAQPQFRKAVVAAREAGRTERTYRLWLTHPFRGLRPPAGKGHGGKPRFSCGRG